MSVDTWKEKIREKEGTDLGAGSYRTTPEEIPDTPFQMRYLLVGPEGCGNATKGIYVETNAVPLLDSAEDQLLRTIGECVTSLFIDKKTAPTFGDEDMIDVLNAFQLSSGYEDDQGRTILKIEPVLPSLITGLFPNLS